MDPTTVNGLAKAIAIQLWRLEKANPSVDFSGLHSVLKTGHTYLIENGPEGVQPLDGGGKEQQ